MKLPATAMAVLVGAAHARFSGTFWITLSRDESTCADADIYPKDDKLNSLSCRDTTDCHLNGNEIASAHWVCSDSDGQVDIFSYPHDTLKYCRAGFCSCMTTRYGGKVPGGAYGPPRVRFDFDDDHAWGC